MTWRAATTILRQARRGRWVCGCVPATAAHQSPQHVTPKKAPSTKKPMSKKVVTKAKKGASKDKVGDDAWCVVIT